MAINSNNAKRMLPREFVDEGVKLAETCTLFGIHLTELSKDELLAAAAKGWNAYNKQLDQGLSNMRMMLDISQDRRIVTQQQGEIESLRCQLSELRRQLEESAESIRQYSIREGELRRQLEEAKSTLKSYVDDKAELESCFAEMKNEIESLKKQLEEAKAELRTVKDAAADYDSRFEKDQQQLAAFAAVIEKMREALHSAVHYAVNPGHYGRYKTKWDEALSLSADHESVLLERDVALLEKVADMFSNQHSNGYVWLTAVAASSLVNELTAKVRNREDAL